jgi:hypothetical protein
VAREYVIHSAAERVVLFEFAIHADDRGYTWPSAVGIASRWHHDDETITKAIKALLDRRAFSLTKKRRGKTGRLKVYRLPKITWEIPRQSATNKEQGRKNKEQRRKEN